ncbi:MAG: 50S ribosomal protein L11 methyltransferase [Planctomycetes bacterium]|nr:50S ribosomal protein L11 methyltransferase [Planctomycetota bacterium]
MGTGVLAVAAARAGARHIYAIESTGIAKIAKEVFAANSLAEKITLIEGRD